MSQLFKYFDAVNEGNHSYVDNMSDDEVKEIQPFVLLSWMHGANNNTPHHVILTDLYCNPYVFSLQKHKRLLLKLFIEANGEMGDTRYSFVKPTTKKSDKNIQAIAKYYQISLKDAADYANLMTEQDIKDIHQIIESME